ncbi:MAG: hypothetical protein AB4042_00815 [Leptolyngbyaceae cyanobacterium]
MPHSDFLSLQISIDEVTRACNLDKTSLTYITRPRNKVEEFLALGFSGSIFAGIVPVLIAAFGFNRSSLILLVLSILCATILYFITMAFLFRVNEKSVQGREKMFKHVIRLKQAVQNFNSLLEGIAALDEAQRSGSRNRLQSREKLMDLLTVVRADLLCAFKIDKVFRENPNLSTSSFSANSFPLELDPLKLTQLSEESSDYGRLFDEALQLGLSVQEEVQRLQQERN